MRPAQALAIASVGWLVGFGAVGRYHPSGEPPKPTVAPLERLSEQVARSCALRPNPGGKPNPKLVCE